MKKILIIILIFFLSYIVGGVTGRHELFPWPQLSALKRHISPPVVPASRYVFDANGRVLADESKSPIACPVQTDRTAVLMVLGQSNAANYGGQRYRSKHGEQVINFFNDKCFVAASPLLGSTGTKGEYWTQAANLLIDSGRYEHVVIAPLAFSGSEVARWASGGDINRMLVDLANQIKRQGYQVNHVLWDQGEADFVKGTSTEAYRDRLLSMIDTLRQQDITAPVYVSIASKCLEPSNNGFKTHSPDNSIVKAQMALSERGRNISRGVNTDELLDEVDRYDDCHIGGSGMEKVARAWAKILLDDEQRVTLRSQMQ
jgi:Carbohydrate esterase, sialic acid-specific acetylesterase